ncbi:uncharacterized protein LOC130702786 [Daphnia carinata]|uniref:uncharacterized protein LOC130702786 n=1 Tax=Daphnia carinata TaxID=120202 RepID=UPI0025794DB0|nr:uncharacterized protein LOC130702786 [Daphnia carinata]
MAKKFVKLGSLEEIPSLRLILLGLVEAECIPYLERPKLIHNSKSHEKITSIEASPALISCRRSRVWLSLRITKHILHCDPDRALNFRNYRTRHPKSCLNNLTELAISSVIRPRVGRCLAARRLERPADLYALLKSTSSGDGVDLDRYCPSCTHSLITMATVQYTQYCQLYPAVHEWRVIINPL